MSDRSRFSIASDGMVDDVRELYHGVPVEEDAKDFLVPGQQVAISAVIFLKPTFGSKASRNPRNIQWLVGPK